MKTAEKPRKPGNTWLQLLKAREMSTGLVALLPQVQDFTKPTKLSQQLINEEIGSYNIFITPNTLLHPEFIYFSLYHRKKNKIVSLDTSYSTLEANARQHSGSLELDSLLPLDHRQHYTSTL